MLDSNYNQFINTLKEKIKSTQIRAALAINQEVLKLYWEIGKGIIELEKKSVWGQRMYQKLSSDLTTSFPNSRGYSTTNLKRMRLFAENYPIFKIGAQPVHQLPWGHIVILLHKIKDLSIRDWYSLQTIDNGWSRAQLSEMIQSDLHQRQVNSTQKSSNFAAQLPNNHGSLIHELQKSPYNFDFMSLTEEAKERDIEFAGIHNIRKLLMELGKGFAFLGSQVPIEIDNREYFIDMLFYHVHLHCYIIVELKATEFEPEHAGKLNFYLNAADSILKAPEDKPSIGLLLCKSHSKILAEYALKTINKPIGISNYELTKKLPELMKGNLPSIEELEAELKHLNLD